MSNSSINARRAPTNVSSPNVFPTMDNMAPLANFVTGAMPPNAMLTSSIVQRPSPVPPPPLDPQRNAGVEVPL